jgi:hypothetical protein
MQLEDFFQHARTDSLKCIQASISRYLSDGDKLKINCKSRQYNSPYLSQLLNITFQYKSEVKFLAFVP